MNKQSPKDEVFDKLIQQSGWQKESVESKVFAPGRIEVLGKHTDYAGGDSVTCAVHLGVYLIARKVESKQIRVYSTVYKEELSCDFNGNTVSGDSHWMVYPKVVLNRIVSDFSPFAEGLEIFIDADLPHAAGMSSSSALITGLFLIFDDIIDLKSSQIYQDNIPDRLHLGEYLGAMENGLNYGNFPRREGVGTFGGSEDHVAVLCSKKDHLGYYSYLPTISRSYIPLPSNLSFVVAHSGVFAEKTGNALARYNRASELAQEIREIILRSNPELGNMTLGEMLRKGHADLERVFELIRKCTSLEHANVLCDRYSQFFIENTEIIPNFLESLSQMDLQAAGRQVERSQLLTSVLLKNQVPETIYLAESASRLGAIASSAFGGGFGGSVWSLIEESKASDFLENWKKDYDSQSYQSKDAALFFLAKAESGAQVYP